MTPLVFSLWNEIIENAEDDDDKFIAMSAVLQVYAAILGMPVQDFKNLTNQIAATYSGPLPEGYSEEILGRYHRVQENE